MADKALVLSSGGIDSTTCLAMAVESLGAENVAAVSFFYGQKHKKELHCSELVARHYGVRHYELDLARIFAFSDCSLLAHSTQEITHRSYAEQIRQNGEGMVSTYVPFRNGLFLSAAASLAVSLFPSQTAGLYIGAHADDAAGQAYADCSPEFTGAMADAIRIGTYGKIEITAPFVHMTKAQIVAEGLKLRVPYELTWSCYEGGEKACGTCGTCIDRKAAFEINGAKDPIPYGG